jgi:DNA-binding NarL/FixJ family response regulator
VGVAGAPGAGDFLVGREAELTVLAEFVSPAPPSPALLLTGEPGIGKTALWEAGLGLAGQCGFRVLAARPGEAEPPHSFAGLFDLLETVGADVLAGLPGPQRRALEAALLRSDPAGQAPGPFAVAAGLLGVLRCLAANTPLLVAIDDLQWLDPASAAALAFAMRRLDTAQGRFLLARRSGQSTEAERALGAAGVRRVEVGPLSVEGTYRLLSQRTGLTVPPRTLSRLHAAARGIPLLVLELGQLLAARGPRFLDAGLPVADVPPSPFQGGRVAGLDRPGAAERPVAHRETAGSAPDETARARHLAQACTGTNARLAGVVAVAADKARHCGAAFDAVDLAEHAARLTPPGAPDRPGRLLALAENLVMVGEPDRATELIAPLIGDFPAGAARARAHLLLANAGTVTEHQDHLDRALAESREEPELQAAALAAKAVLLGVIQVQRIGEAEASARQARALVTSRGAPVERQVLQALAWVRVMRGLPLDDLAGLAAAQPPAVLYESSIDRQAGIRLAFRGQVAEARQVFRALAKLAGERGEAWFLAAIRLQLCEVELRAGNVRECARLIDQQHEWAALEDLGANWARCQALLAAISGIPHDVAQWAASFAAIAVASPDDPGLQWDELEVGRALGVAALLAGQPERAAEALGPVWEHARREGINDPGAFPAAPDLVEALIALGRLTEAAAVTSRLRELAGSQHHPWGLATADRCASAIALASGYDDDAAAQLAAAASVLGELGLAFDCARSLLWLGQAARRARKRSVARRYLEAAATAFADIGSDGWAEQARTEMARLGQGRTGHGAELTVTEQRVAALAAEGLSNKQIATRLTIAAHTVEVHLAHVYAKLAIRSRTQLAKHLARFPGPDVGD